MSETTATFIAPDHYGPVDIEAGDTIADVLERIGQDAASIVKLDGKQRDLDDGVAAGGIYLVVPGSVAKGGFDGALCPLDGEAGEHQHLFHDDVYVGSTHLFDHVPD